MRTNIVINDELMTEAMKAMGAKTKREAVERALRESLQLRQQSDIMKLWGIGWEGDLDEMRTDKPLVEHG